MTQFIIGFLLGGLIGAILIVYLVAKEQINIDVCEKCRRANK